jgi:transcriptional regulator with XRE-family HTH domain
MKFGEKLRELREHAGLSQAELAKSSGVPLWTLRKFEQGRREPLWLVLFQLADILDVPVDAFRECLGANHRRARPKPTPASESALADDIDRPRQTRRPEHPEAPTPTYKASPLTRSKLGTFTSRCRLLCERCAVVLGHVDSTFRHTGMSADQVIARWPEMREAVQRHEEQCRLEKRME